jgi:hypothetical protein
VTSYHIDQTDITVASVLNPPLPPSNLYFMSIMRIYQVKHGPFFEHSSQLHSIAVGVPNWGKVNSGLFKMYEVMVMHSLRPTLFIDSSLGRSPGQEGSSSASTPGRSDGMGRRCCSASRATDIARRACVRGYPRSLDKSSLRIVNALLPTGHTKSKYFFAVTAFTP